MHIHMCFKIFGCNITVSFLFLCFITSLMLFDNSGLIKWGFCAAFIHEAGHIIAMVYKNIKPEEIKLGLFDISIIKNKTCNYISFKDEVIILISGSLANLAISCICFIIGLNVDNNMCLILIQENLFLGLMNLLPVESLDGGDLLYIIISEKINVVVAKRILHLTSFIILIPLMSIGFLILFKSKCNFSLLLVSFYLLTVILEKNDKIKV